MCHPAGGRHCILLSFCYICEGRFVVKKNSLKVTGPNTLKGTYECAIGNFGMPQYGGTMVNVIAYTKANQKAYKGFDDMTSPQRESSGPSPLSCSSTGEVSGIDSYSFA
jgi:hypothetical protein